MLTIGNWMVHIKDHCYSEDCGFISIIVISIIMKKVDGLGNNM
jgi:hypothetical protein